MGDLWPIFSSFLTWYALYFCLCRLHKRSPEWNCRLVTVVHAVLITSLAAWCGFVQGPWPFTDPGGPNTPLQRQAAIISLGYFLFDFSWCLIYSTEGPLMLAHHFACLCFLTMCLAMKRYGTEMVAVMFGGELTNPFLQLRWYLRETGQYKTTFGEAVDLTFLFLFTFVRIGVGGYLFYCYMVHPRPDIWGRLGGCAMYTISLIFWFHIVKFAIRKYSPLFTAHKLGAQRITTPSNCDNNVDAKGDATDSSVHDPPNNLINRATRSPISCRDNLKAEQQFRDKNQVNCFS